MRVRNSAFTAACLHCGFLMMCEQDRNDQNVAYFYCSTRRCEAYRIRGKYHIPTVELEPAGMEGDPFP